MEFFQIVDVNTTEEAIQENLTPGYLEDLRIGLTSYFS